MAFAASSSRRFTMAVQIAEWAIRPECLACGSRQLSDMLCSMIRVKGVKKLGVRLGNWLTAEQGQALWKAPDRERLKGKRERALLAVPLSCGLRRHELAELTLGHLQQREGHCAIVD